MDKDSNDYKLESEERLHNEPLISFIDNDFVLNFLNDFDHPVKNNNYDNLPPMNHQMFTHDIGLNNQSANNFPGDGYNKFQIDNNNNPFYNGNEWNGFAQPNNVKNSNNNFFISPQQQGQPQIFQNGGSLKGAKNEEKEKQMFNAQSLAYSENFNPRSYIKNTYINKINNLMSNSLNDFKVNEEKKKVMIKIEPNLKLNANNSLNSPNSPKQIKEEDVDFSKLSELDKLNLKLKRNRESARNSRKRKKIYIDLLETKVTELSDELALANKGLETNAMNFSKMNSQARIMNNLIMERQALFEKLDKGIKNHLEENEINLLIDSLRLRLGASGKDRVSVLNFFFKKIFNLILPPYMRYLLWVALLDKDIFSEDFLRNDIKIEENEPLGTNLLRKFPMAESHKKMIPKYKKKFLASYSRVGGIIDSMNKLKDDLYKETNNLENILDEFRNIFKPREIGSFLLDIEQNKSCKLYSSYNLFLKKDKDGEINEESEEDYEEVEDKEGGDDDDDDEIKYKATLPNENGNISEQPKVVKLTKSHYKRKKRHLESDDDI